MSKIIQPEGFRSAFLGKFASPLIKVVITFAKSVLAPLGTITSASAIDGAVQRKCVDKQV